MSIGRPAQILHARLLLCLKCSWLHLELSCMTQRSHVQHLVCVYTGTSESLPIATLAVLTGAQGLFNHFTCVCVCVCVCVCNFWLQNLQEICAGLSKSGIRWLVTSVLQD
jgi:hypothetical protein